MGVQFNAMNRPITPVSNDSLKHSNRAAWMLLVLIAVVTAAMLLLPGFISSKEDATLTQRRFLIHPIVFVSRQIPPNGTIYWNTPNDLPGVGPHSRFRPAAPGKLLIREVSGNLRTLVDGSHPTLQSMMLIDVNAPDVSYDRTRILFAGLPQGSYNTNPGGSCGAWRIYSIKVDGTDLKQITFSDQQYSQQELRDHFPADPSGFFQAADRFFNEGYDDTDPCWLPDGRICFASTRYYSFAQYSGVRTTNLFVVNADGSDLHRITSERNGAERPMVDPLTGKIVYARWWRNHRFPVDDLSTIPDPNGGYVQKDGLSADRNNQTGGPDFLFRNAWHAAAINPDGTELVMYSDFFRGDDDNHMYGGSFAPNGDLFASYFPMTNMTEASGFGGIRKIPRGFGKYASILGITYPTLDYVHPSNPTSYGVFVGSYAADPCVLRDGRLLVCWTPNIAQDYGLYVCNSDGSNKAFVCNLPGTTELRPKELVARPLPPVIQDIIPERAPTLPPMTEMDAYNQGVFLFNDFNVYFNAPVDTDIVSAPAVGSAKSIRFFMDQQRSSPGSFPNLDWPTLLQEAPVSPDGFLSTEVPADVPLFEQIRSENQATVPFTGGPYRDGAAHVAGLNFGRPDAIVNCVGCHTGHSMIPVPTSPETILYTNLAPGATLSVSSSRDPNYIGGLTDRKVMKGEIWRYWNSASSQQSGQWVRLDFPVPIRVKYVRIYNPRQGDVANCSIRVNQTTVQLLQNNAVVTQRTSGPVAVQGTVVLFKNVRCNAVKIFLDNVTGTFYGSHLAALAEVEVVAKGEN